MGNIIDLSKWNGNINWDKVKQDNIDFIIFRASCGNSKDANFETYAKACNDRGIPFGVYHYSYALTEAAALNEIKIFYNTAKPYKPKFWVLDIEDASQLYKNGKSLPMNPNLKSLVSYMYTQLRGRVGSKGKIVYYGGSSVFEPYGHLSAIKWDAIWFANYSTKTTPYAVLNNNKIYCDLWQYASNGKINGISSNVDMNKITDKTTKTLDWWIGVTEESKETEVNVPMFNVDLNGDKKIVKITEGTAWNVRDCPNTDKSKVVGFAKLNEEYDWIATSWDGWLWIEGNGISGWVSPKAGKVITQ